MCTMLYPMVQFKKDTWEIDEFDCTSIYLLVGTEKAMVIDTGMGIGNLRGAIEQFTDKPLITVITRNHSARTGNARQFDDLWINEKDLNAPIPQGVERRRFDVIRIAKRQKGSLDGVYKMFNLYPYDIDEDLADPGTEDSMPEIHNITDEMKFDLGGGRIVTAYSCPVHSPGQMVFLDEQTRTLFAGSAVNYHLRGMSVPLETSLRSLKKLQMLNDKYDGIWNGSHEFRAVGAPLDDDCLPNAIAVMEDALDGHIVPVEEPDFWGQELLLKKKMRDAAVTDDLGIGQRNTKVTLRKGRNFVTIDPNNLYKTKKQKKG